MRSLTPLLLVAMLATCAGTACGPIDHWLPPASPTYYYFTEGSSPQQLERVTVDGKVSILPGKRQLSGYVASPNGQRVLFTDGTVVDAAGRTVATGIRPTGWTIWDEDSTHLCTAADADGKAPVVLQTGGGPPGFVIYSKPIYLWSVSLDGAARRVAQIPETPNGSGFSLISCDLARDEAFVDCGTNLYSIRLSTGQATSVPREAVPGATIRSPDGRLTAGNEPDRKVWVAGIYASDGAEVARFPGTTVLAFSADGRLVIDEHGPSGQPGVPQPVNLRDWRTGKVLWSTEGAVQGLVARPGGDGFLLAVSPPYSMNEDILVVHADGRSEVVASGVIARLPRHGW